MFLIRDLVSPRTWLAMIHHPAGLLIGLPAFFIAVFGVVYGFSTVPLGSPACSMTPAT